MTLVLILCIIMGLFDLIAFFSSFNSNGGWNVALPYLSSFILCIFFVLVAINIFNLRSDIIERKNEIEQLENKIKKLEQDREPSDDTNL